MASRSPSMSSAPWRSAPSSRGAGSRRASRSTACGARRTRARARCCATRPAARFAPPPRGGREHLRAQRHAARRARRLRGRRARGQPARLGPHGRQPGRLRRAGRSGSGPTPSSTSALTWALGLGGGAGAAGSRVVDARRATRLARRAHRGPLVVQRPFFPEGPEVCHVYLLHPPGGLVGGDELTVDVRRRTRARTRW